MYDYNGFFEDSTKRLQRERRYRRFRSFERIPGAFPRVRWTDASAPAGGRDVTVWCSNDYLGMSQHPVVLEAGRAALERYGAGAGGTRNISGTHEPIVALEAELASLHRRDGALVFSSGYVANDTTLATLGSQLPGCVILSDASNHASMIEGMRRSRAEIRVFAHNDARALEHELARLPKDRPRIVAIESLYSMDGDIAPLGELFAVARDHGALTFVDETHAVGVHGAEGGGLVEAHGLLDQVDVLQGGLGKGFGVVGGFITARAPLIDFIRSHAPGFIFTTALPPAVAASALASVRHLRHSGVERAALRERVASLRAALDARALPVLPTTSQILPLMVGDAGRCERLAARLLQDFGIYLQPINFPTVPRGTERLRITASPRHTDAMQRELVDALAACAGELLAQAAA